MNKIVKTWIFKLSIASSVLLFVAMLYGQKTANVNFAAGIFIDILAVLLFTSVLIWSLIFWIKYRAMYRRAFLPFLINLLFLALIMITPFNWIREKMGFSVDHNLYKNVAGMGTNKPIL